MKITLLSADGTFKAAGLNMTISTHSVDPNDPRLYHPKLCACKHRENMCRVSGCGKRVIFEWYCKLFGKMVGPKPCGACDAEKS